MGHLNFWSSPAAMEHVAESQARARALQNTGEQWIAYAANLEEQIKSIMHELRIEKCHSSGLRAQAVALKETLVEIDDPKAKDMIEGGDQSKLSKIYDKSFCDKAEELGLEYPEQYIK